MIQRRPYHAGSVLGPAPTQDLTPSQGVDWKTRIRGYWPRANARAEKIATALLSFMGPDGSLMPSLESIADAAKTCVKTVGRWIEAFVLAGFVRKILRRNLFGQTSNAYVILFPDEPQEAGSPPLPEHSSKLSIYNAEEDSNGESSMDSLPPAAAARRVNALLGWAMRAVRPAPQAPQRTVQEQIAMLNGRPVPS